MSKEKFTITTLGSFEIKSNNISLLDNMSKSHKILDLLKYFLTFQDKKIPPQTIIDNILSFNKSNDPKNALRTQIFRLRKMLSESSIADDKVYIDIITAGEYYMLYLDESVYFDALEFEKLVKEANKSKDINKIKAKEHYKQALQLYKGNYLEEDIHSLWLVSVRNYYNRLFIQALDNIVDILREEERYEQIADICEEALKVEPNEENLHIYFMEALLMLGQAKHALKHYEYTFDWYQQELGINPSEAMKDIYQKIKSHAQETSYTDLSKIVTELDEEINEGPLLCSVADFKNLYKISCRREDRKDI